MKTVEEALMTRLTGDATLVSLLGGSGRIYHAMEKVEPKINSITFMAITSVPEGLTGDVVMSRREDYMLSIFHNQYEDVLDRIFKLLHMYQFPTPSDAGIVKAMWDWEGPDEFDEDLKVGKKTVRYKFYVVRQAFAPI